MEKIPTKLSPPPFLLLKNKGFTLIELLVVVLIISILAAIAVPQYRLAVAKTELTKYMAIVKAMADAEEAYFLKNGNYTDDLDKLGVQPPIDADCVRESKSLWRCAGDVSYRIADKATNVQAGPATMRYLYYIQDFENSNFSAKKGETFCFAGKNNATANKVCEGNNGEFVGTGTWNYYKLGN